MRHAPGLLGHGQHAIRGYWRRHDPGLELLSARQGISDMALVRRSWLRQQQHLSPAQTGVRQLCQGLSQARALGSSIDSSSRCGVIGSAGSGRHTLRKAPRARVVDSQYACAVKPSSSAALTTDSRTRMAATSICTRDTTTVMFRYAASAMTRRCSLVTCCLTHLQALRRGHT